MNESIGLQKPTRDDASWLFQTYEDCMRRYVEPAYGWDEAWQRNGLLNSLRSGVWRILLRDEVRCGMVHWETTATSITLKMLCVIPSMQRQGIGNAVLHKLTQHAQTGAKTLTLKVLSGNRIAHEWYVRHGFVESTRDWHTFTLVWQAKR